MKATRECPRECGELTQKTSKGIEVDLCEECGGIWLDSGEFDPLIAERFAGEPLESFLALTSEEVTLGALSCPADTQKMRRVLFEELELDWCPECHGIWIDGDERRALSRRDEESVSSAPEEAAGLHPGERMIDLSDAPPIPSREPAEGNIGLPGLREIEFEPVEESAPPKLDRSVSSAADKGDVVCAACAQLYPRHQTIRLMDAYWCELCVVEGDYPGSHGPPVARRVAEAAQSMASARARLAERREVTEEIKRVHAVARHRNRKWGRDGGSELAVGIQATARTLRSLFFGDK